MSADLTSKDEKDDAEFRARLAPLASEVLPGGARPAGEGPAATRLRLIARAGNGVGESGEVALAAVSRTNAASLDTLDAARFDAVRRGAVRPDVAGPGTPHRSSRLLRGIVLAAAAILAAAVGVAWFFTLGPPEASLPVHIPAPVHPEPGGAAGPVGQAATRTTDAASAPPAPPPSPEMVGLLMRRGDAAVAVGDIIAARLLYERAAGLGSAVAATAAGKTYDIDFLLRTGAHGIRADPAAAAAWYRKAVALGDPEARAALARIEAVRGSTGGPVGGPAGGPVGGPVGGR